MTGFNKRIMAALLCALMLLGITGCTDSAKEKEHDLTVVSTIFASYDFARQIAGEYGYVSMLLKPGAESHSYEPTPKDIVTLSECDVFIYVGGENDAWVDSILESMDTSDMTIIEMLGLVEKYEEEYVEGMENHDHEEEHGHEDKSEWDEHVWTSPKNAMIICKALKDAFSNVNSADSAQYEANYSQYITELEKLDEDIRQAVESVNKDTLVFGDRFPLRYFTEEYGLSYFAAFPGCSSDTEASAATIAFLIDKVKSENIPIVFKIELSSDSMAKTIAEDAGAKVATFNTCHNVTAKEFKDGATYLSLMYDNLEVLKEALQ